MGLISNDVKYKKDKTLSDSDSWVGSDSSDSKKTKTYTLGDITSYLLDKYNLAGVNGVFQNTLLIGNYYKIVDYDYFVYADKWILDNVVYQEHIEATVTLSPADDTFDRFDVIVINLDKTIDVIEGTPDANPSKPSTDPAIHLEVGFILVKASTTEDASVVNTIIYDENLQQAGGEFDTVAFQNSIVDSVLSPDTGTTHIIMPIGIGVVVLNKTGYINIADIDKVIIRVRKVTTDYSQLTFTFRDTNGTASEQQGKQIAIADTVNANFWNFDTNNISNYQTIVIDKSFFSTGNFQITKFNKLRIVKGGNIDANTVAADCVYHIDRIYAQSGTPTTTVAPTTIPTLQQVSDTGNETTKKLVSKIVDADIDNDPTGEVLPNRNWVNNQGFTKDTDLSLQVFQPPYLEELIPDTYLPSTTGNFILRGAYFVPEMCNGVIANAIQVSGTNVINYSTFINDNTIVVNLTTSATDGNYNVTLNNGLSITYNGVLSIVNGTVYKPSADDLMLNAGTADLTVDGEIKKNTENSTAQVDLNYNIPIGQDFQLRWKGLKSPLRTNTYVDGTVYIDLWQNGILRYRAQYWYIPQVLRVYQVSNGFNPVVPYAQHAPPSGNVLGQEYFFQRIGTQMIVKYGSTVLATFTDLSSVGDISIKFGIDKFDLVDIKRIDLSDTGGALQDRRTRTSSLNVDTLDLTNIPSYANDGAAATGLIPLGGGYINSSTGALQKRLT